MGLYSSKVPNVELAILPLPAARNPGGLLNIPSHHIVKQNEWSNRKNDPFATRSIYILSPPCNASIFNIPSRYLLSRLFCSWEVGYSEMLLASGLIPRHSIPSAPKDKFGHCRFSVQKPSFPFTTVTTYSATSVPATLDFWIHTSIALPFTWSET